MKLRAGFFNGSHQKNKTQAKIQEKIHHPFDQNYICACFSRNGFFFIRKHILITFVKINQFLTNHTKNNKTRQKGLHKQLPSEVNIALANFQISKRLLYYF